MVLNFHWLTKVAQLALDQPIKDKITFITKCKTETDAYPDFASKTEEAIKNFNFEEKSREIMVCKKPIYNIAKN